MAITVKKVEVWAKSGADRTGLLADALEPLAAAGADLQVVMTYCHPGQADRATVEVYPVSGRKAQSAARAAGMSPSETACLLVEGDDRPGLGAQLARAIASVGVGMSFVMTQAQGRRFSSILGFRNPTDAAIAAKAIKMFSSNKNKVR
jgi:predicted amino acid-binding ACT domain protein